jgi:hypothetical protein
VEATSGRTITVESLQTGTGVFHDREYEFDSLGDFQGKTFIKYSNDDKAIDKDHVMIKVRTLEPVTVYVLKMGTYNMEWLQTGGWTESHHAGVSYSGVRETRHKEWDPSLLTTDHFEATSVHSKTFPAGTISLPGNQGTDGSFLIFLEKGAGEPEPPLCPGVDTSGEWTVAQGAATSAHAGVAVGAECFNAMFAACPVVRYTNAPMAGSPAIYVRHSGAYGGDAHQLFTHLWAHADNEFHTDFDIYSSVDDARSGSNPWTFCNFSDQPQPNHFTVGFPRDCGPTGYQPHIWFHATRGSGSQTSGFFEVYTGADCPAH